MVPPDSHQVSRDWCYSGYRRIWSPHLTGLSPSVAAVPGTSHRDSSSLYGPTTPGTFACPRFGLFPFRSPLLWESRLISVPAVTEMFQFSAFAPVPLCIQGTVTLIGPGFPIRKSADQSPFAGSPQLIAGCRVLHRLLSPRHPPHALIRLTL